MTKPTPVTEDVHATSTELLARAAQDYTHATTVAEAHEDQGGTGIREGVLPGSYR